MICNQSLENFIHVIAKEEDSATAIGQAFSDFGKLYGVAGLQLDFSVSGSALQKEGIRKQLFLYRSEAPLSEDYDFEKHFVTGEKGNVIFRFYADADKKTFSDDEKRDLDLLTDLIFMHCGRWRLINLVKYVGMNDSLTGLPNSGGILAYMDELLAKKELTAYNAYYFNLSRFSLVNKKFGSKETDRIIVKYCDALKSFLTEGELLGRLGGDNFVALIRKERTEGFLTLLSGVEVQGQLLGRAVPVMISAVAGVLEIDEQVMTGGQVIDDCNTALNIAKHIEKKPYQFVSPELRMKSFKQKQIVSGFMEALKKREFCVYYQPKVHTENYSIVGAEALARWIQDGKVISPAEFIPVIEQTDMVCALDFYVLEQVCMDIRDWLMRGIQPIKVSVNFSRKHLSNRNLAKDIMSVLDKYATESKYIEVELTETVDEAESDLLVNFMEEMKEYNVSMSIDDFGTGYSSLNMLRSFPVDVLKIDKSFIDNLEENDRIVLSNIINMATELQMEVVAEGVETVQQLEYLRENNCRVVQGFLFDKPMPKEQFENKIHMGNYSQELAEVNK